MVQKKRWLKKRLSGQFPFSGENGNCHFIQRPVQHQFGQRCFSAPDLHFFCFKRNQKSQKRPKSRFMEIIQWQYRSLFQTEGDDISPCWLLVTMWWSSCHGAQVCWSFFFLGPGQLKWFMSFGLSVVEVINSNSSSCIMVNRLYTALKCQMKNIILKA